MPAGPAIPACGYGSVKNEKAVPSRRARHALPSQPAAGSANAGVTPTGVAAMSERETLEMDVLFVGAGPASLAGAYHLARLAKAAGMELSIGDRKSTRLNSSHRCISYAVFCLKKKKMYSSKRLVLTSICI